MPYLKQIAAHTNCQNIQRYLEKNNRALAKDFFNLSVDERDGYGDEGKEGVRWADEMDALRSRFGNDRPFGNLRARTYKHFIVSPRMTSIFPRCASWLAHGRLSTSRTTRWPSSITTTTNPASRMRTSS